MPKLLVDKECLVKCPNPNILPLQGTDGLSHLGVCIDSHFCPSRCKYLISFDKDTGEYGTIDCNYGEDKQSLGKGEGE